MLVTSKDLGKLINCGMDVYDCMEKLSIHSITFYCHNFSKFYLSVGTVEGYTEIVINKNTNMVEYIENHTHID